MTDRILTEYLKPIAESRRRWELWRRLFRCWMACAALGALALLLRWFTGWSSPLIFLALIAGAIVGAWAAFQNYLRTPLDYRAVAREIESENPELRSLLLTAVDQEPEGSATSLNFFQQRVVSEALEHPSRAQWGESLVSRLHAARAAQGLAFVCLVAVLVGLRPHFSMNMHWLVERPVADSVVISPGDTNIERGSSLVVLARFTGRLPADAELVVKPLNQPERRISLAKNLADPVFGGGLPEVREGLTYRVEYSHGKTRDFKVGVFEYPRLERADAKITYPGYTLLPEKTIPDTRRVSAVEGSTLDYTFHLNKPVTRAKLIARDKSVVPLTVNPGSRAVLKTSLKLDQSKRFELELVDDAGRTNKLPPEFVLEALKNRAPDLKFVLPRGDQRLSPLQEISFQAEATGDYGLRSYGIGYSMADGEPKTLELGSNTKAHEKRAINYLLALESLKAEPDQLLSYYVWAEDTGPDGLPRRTMSDMYFAEIRPFEQIYREGQSADNNNSDSSQSGGQGQGQQQSQKLNEVQRQIITAIWNLQRRETGAKPTDKFKDDAGVVRDSQKEALDQVRTLKESAEDPKAKGALADAEKAMVKSAEALAEAADKNSVKPLSTALSQARSASQDLLKLSAREMQVARAQRGQQKGSGGGSSAAQQRELDQMDLKQSENRYETQREAAAAAKTPQQREQVQVVNRLKELAQRQQDLNDRIREMQASLQEARTEAEKQEMRDRLKRLREEQQDLLADVDDVRQRMDRPENQNQMSDAKQQLDQTRSEVQQAGEALDRNSVPDALSAGTRAQRDLRQIEQDVRKASSGQFTDDMRRVRDSARDLASKQDEIAKKLNDISEPQQKTLSESDEHRRERQEIADQLVKQKTALTNLYNQMREVSSQSESAEPLLSSRLYDLVRQTGQEDIEKSLDTANEFVQRGFAPQAAPTEEKARQKIGELKAGVEQAAESILGDDTESLRLAQRELDNLTRQLEQELTENGVGRGTNGAPGSRGDAAARDLASARQPGEKPGDQNGEGQRGGQGQQKQGEPGQGQRGQQPGQQPGEGQGRGQQGQQPGGQGQAQANNPSDRQDAQGQGGQNGAGGRNARQQAQAGGRDGSRTAQRGGNPADLNEDPRTRLVREAGGAVVNSGAYGEGGGYWGPLIGDDYVDWSDRLRAVEEMVDLPEIQTEVARIRDRARAIRMDYKRLGKKPDWAVVKTQISKPLAEVRTRVGEELARRDSKDALVPLDRDPVPTKYAERVRKYYEQLGKSE